MYSTNSADEAVIANLAMAYGRLDRMDKAIELIEEGFKFRPGYFRFHNVLASIYYQSGQPELALRHLAESVNTSPTQTWPYQQQATIYTNRREYDLAISAYDQAISNGVENPEVIHHQVGMIEGARERWPAAIERFQKAVARDAAYTMAYVYLSRTLAEIGRFTEAREALDWADLLRTHKPQRLEARRRLIDLENEARDAVSDS
jgi:Tfp pilus assembly protein PilF